MINLRMVTPEGLFNCCDTSIINIDTIDGQRGILSNHMPIVLMLKIGAMSVIVDGVRKYYAVNGGMLYFKDNQATILSDAIEDAEDIDVNRAKQALERAKQRIAHPHEGLDLKRAELALSKALNRINVSTKAK